MFSKNSTLQNPAAVSPDSVRYALAVTPLATPGIFLLPERLLQDIQFPLCDNNAEGAVFVVIDISEPPPFLAAPPISEEPRLNSEYAVGKEAARGG